MSTNCTRVDFEITKHYIKPRTLPNSHVKCIAVAEWKMLPVLKMISPFPFDVGIGKILEFMWCPTFCGYIAYCPFFGNILSKSVKAYEHSAISQF